jgi:hypothetical protein
MVGSQEPIPNQVADLDPQALFRRQTTEAVVSAASRSAHERPPVCSKSLGKLAYRGVLDIGIS